MAILIAEGTITRTFFNGKGAELTETFKKRDGTEGKKRYTLWFQSEHGLAEGDTGKFSGMFDSSVDEWQDREGATRHSVKVSLNNARVDGQGTSQGQQDTRTAPSVTDPEPWSQAGAQGFDQGLPF